MEESGEWEVDIERGGLFVTIKVFIGWDSREALAYHVLAHSIWRHASVPVSITPLRLDQLPMYRERDPLQSTDFAFSRFLVPALCDFQGWALFMDCDMLCRADIKQIWDMRDEKYAVMVVQHDHRPPERTKMDGQYQTTYQRKNWSSLILFNNSACHELTPHRVNTESGLFLHQFKWLEDSQIGELPQDLPGLRIFLLA